MQILLYLLIMILGTASYAVGVYQVIRGRYAPSVFSRVVWFLLGVNSFAAVVASDGSKPSVLLAGLFLAGNTAMLLVSARKGDKTFGRLEAVCLGLLAISVAVWVLFHAPLINLGLGLLTHFIGAAPTYRRVWNKPSSENTAFWALFFAASVISIFASKDVSWQAIIFPIYFSVFDGSLFVLSMRRSKSAIIAA